MYAGERISRGGEGIKSKVCNIYANAWRRIMLEREKDWERQERMQ